MEKKETFETNMAELEKMIDELESGEVHLEKSIEMYAKAMHLAKSCDEKLKKIEEQVSQILTENGQLEEFSIEE